MSKLLLDIWDFLSVSCKLEGLKVKVRSSCESARELCDSESKISKSGSKIGSEKTTTTEYLILDLRNQDNQALLPRLVKAKC